jgi:hypothetical protein
MCSSSAFICLDLLFLLGINNCIIHACATFSMVIICYVDDYKFLECAIWYFS